MKDATSGGTRGGHDEAPTFSYPPFHRLRWSPRSVEKLRGPARRLKAGELLVSTGQTLTDVYYIEEGELEVAVGTPGGAVKIVHVMPQGSIFGELQVFTNLTTSPVTVTARRPSLLRRTPHEAFRRLALSDPEFAAEVMSSMSFKALSFLKQVEDLAFRGVRKRIAYVLYALFSGSADDSVSLAIAQEAIADLVAAHRVTVTLALKELQEAGMIAVGRGRLFLLDEARLLAEALSTDR